MKTLITIIALLAMAAPASATLLFYDGFEYVGNPASGSNGNLIGSTNATYGGTYVRASDNIGGTTATFTTQNVGNGSVEYPHASQQPSPGGVLQVNRAQAGKNLGTSIAIPGGPITSGSVFFSFTMELRGWTNLSAAASRSGNNWLGGMLAGFHGLAPGNAMGSLAQSYGTQIRLLRYVDETQNGTADPNQAQRYHIGVAKNLPSDNRVTSWYGATTTATPLTDTSDIDETFGINDELFIVGEYKFVDGAANDETRIWINPTPGDLSQYDTPTVPVVNAHSAVTDSPNGIVSFFFYGDTQTTGPVWIDELRIGTTYADVTPATSIDNANFNGDGAVDGVDFLAWQAGHGITGTGTLVAGDANNDLDVNSADYNIWASQFGTTFPTVPAGSPVPEPSCLALATMLAVLVIRRRSYV